MPGGYVPSYGAPFWWERDLIYAAVVLLGAALLVAAFKWYRSRRDGDDDRW